MLTKRKSRVRHGEEDVRIPRKDRESLKNNPAFSELIELIEDKHDLEEAKLIKGKDISSADYLRKRAIRNNS
jgi:hypothetical protein